MSTVTHSNITVEPTPVQIVDLRSFDRITSPKQDSFSSTPSISIAQYHADLRKAVGEKPHHSLLLSSAEASRNPFFHEACVYLREHEELYVTSNLLPTNSNSQLPIILISKLKLTRDDTGHVTSVEWTKLRPPQNMPMPCSGTRYGTGIVFCSQGNLLPGTGGLFYMPRGKPPSGVVTGYYGREFNSVHDVALGPEGTLWFTDPSHGFEQDFRKKPQLPNQVYCFQPDHGDLRVVADGLGRPTGICFSPDLKTAYITDCEAVSGDGNQDPTKAASIYAFDVIRRSGADFLANKRVFAYALRGIPMGVKCDAQGNVYAGCADGVEVWSPAGTLLGVIEVQGGVTNFCFAREGEMFLCAEQRLWRVCLGNSNASAEGSVRGSVGRPSSPMMVELEDNFI